MPFKDICQGSEHISRCYVVAFLSKTKRSRVVTGGEKTRQVPPAVGAFFSKAASAEKLYSNIRNQKHSISEQECYFRQIN